MRTLKMALLASLSVAWMGIGVRADELAATHAVPAGGYVPGTLIAVTNVFTYPKAQWGSLSSLAMEIDPPAGWQVMSVAGDGSPLLQGNEIIFFGNLSSPPIKFSYTMQVPAGTTGTKQLSSVMWYKYVAIPNPLSIASAPDPLYIGQLGVPVATLIYGK